MIEALLHVGFVHQLRYCKVSYVQYSRPQLFADLVKIPVSRIRKFVANNHINTIHVYLILNGI